MENLGKIVSASAPLLGSVLNSVLPGSGLIISGLSTLFGANPNNTDDLIAKIQQDAESSLKLKQFEIEHQNDLAKIIATDRDSARNRQVEYAKTVGRDWVMDFLAVFITISFVGICFIIAFANINSTEKDLFYMLIGTFGAVWSGVVQYYFGGSPLFMQKPKNQQDLGNQYPPTTPDIILPPPAKTR